MFEACHLGGECLLRPSSLVFLLGDGVTRFCCLFIGAILKLKQMLNKNDVLSIKEQVLRRSVEEQVLSSEKQVSRRKC